MNRPVNLAEVDASSDKCLPFNCNFQPTRYSSGNVIVQCHWIPLVANR